MRSTATLPLRGPLVVVYTDIGGSTELTEQIGDARAHEELVKHNRIVRSALARYRGVELKTTGDGFQLVFANATDALACAVAIQLRLSRREFEQGRSGSLAASIEIRIGVHLGEVIRDGGEIMGRTAIIASRVMSAGRPGQILISPEVRQAAAVPPGTRLEERGRYRLKGLRGSFALSELIWRPSELDGETTSPAELMPRPRPPLIGRASELSALERLVGEVVQGQTRFVVLSGEAGIGKSHLMDDFAAGIEQRRLIVGRGRAYRHYPRPYQPVVQILSAVLAVRSSTGVPPDLAPALQPLRQTSRVLAQYIPQTEERTREVRSEELRDAIVALLIEHATHQPLVVCIDDLQWCDAASVDVLRILLRRAVAFPDSGNWMLVTTLRTPESDHSEIVSELLSELVRSEAFAELRLSPLSAHDVATLVRGIYERMPPPDVQRSIASRCGGNPLFANELARELSSRTGGASEDDRLPSRVQEVIDQRLSRLSKECGGLLCLASLLGPRFRLGVICESANAEPADVSRGLAEAVAARVLEEVGESGEVVYAFSHALIREVLEARLDLASKQWAHRQLAEGLERYYAEDDLGHAGELARHWRAAGRNAPIDKLLRYCRRAGDEAGAVHAWADAVVHYLAALEALERRKGWDDADLAELEARAADALGREGRMEEALPLAERAISRFEAIGAVTRADELRLDTARVLGMHARHSDSLPHLEEVLAARRGNPGVFEGLVLAQYALALDGAGRDQRLRSTARRLGRLAKRLSSPELAERARNAQRNWYVNHTANFGRALTLTRDMATSAEARDDGWYTTMYQNEVAFLELLTGRVGDALDSSTRALQTAERYGSLAEVVNALAIRALGNCLRGDWEAFEEAWAHAGPLLRRVSGALRIGLLIWSRRRADLWLGRPHVKLPSPRRLYAGMGAAELSVAASNALVVSEQHPPDAEPFLRPVQDALQTESRGLHWLIAHQGVGAGWANAGRSDEAAPSFDALAPYRGTFYLGCTAYERARIARLNGWTDLAKREVVYALRVCRRERLVPIEALLLQERGLLCRGEGHTVGAKRALGQSEEMFRQLGMSFAADASRAMLREDDH